MRIKNLNEKMKSKSDRSVSMNRNRKTGKESKNKKNHAIISTLKRFTIKSQHEERNIKAMMVNPRNGFIRLNRKKVIENKIENINQVISFSISCESVMNMKDYLVGIIKRVNSDHGNVRKQRENTQLSNEELEMLEKFLSFIEYIECASAKELIALNNMMKHISFFHFIMHSSYRWIDDYFHCNVRMNNNSNYISKFQFQFVNRNQEKQTGTRNMKRKIHPVTRNDRRNKKKSRFKKIKRSLRMEKKSAIESEYEDNECESNSKPNLIIEDSDSRITVIKKIFKSLYGHLNIPFSKHPQNVVSFIHLPQYRDVKQILMNIFPDINSVINNQSLKLWIRGIDNNNNSNGNNTNSSKNDGRKKRKRTE